MKSSRERRSASEDLGYLIGLALRPLREMFRGKHPSAALFVAAGAGMLLRASLVGHSDPRLFVQFMACLITSVGLLGWCVNSADRKE